MQLPHLLVLVAVFTVFAVILAVVLRKSYHKVKSNEALVITRGRASPRVSFRGGMVLPFIQQAEVIDLSDVPIQVSLDNVSDLKSKDGFPLKVEATFVLHVGRTPEDVVRVAERLGCDKASDPRVIERLFKGELIEAIKTIATAFDLSEAQESRKKFCRKVYDHIGVDLDGVILENVSISFIGMATRLQK